MVIFNHRSNMYHLYSTYITDGNVGNITDWENSRSVSDDEMKEWSFLAYSCYIFSYIVLYVCQCSMLYIVL